MSNSTAKIFPAPPEPEVRLNQSVRKKWDVAPDGIGISADGIGICGDSVAGYEGFELDIVIISTSNYVNMELYVHSIILGPSRIYSALYYTKRSIVWA